MDVVPSGSRSLIACLYLGLPSILATSTAEPFPYQILAVLYVGIVSFFSKHLEIRKSLTRSRVISISQHQSQVAAHVALIPNSKPKQLNVVNRDPWQGLG